MNIGGTGWQPVPPMFGGENLMKRASILRASLLFCLLAAITIIVSTNDASSALNEIRILCYQPVPMRDGVKLYADVYLPRAEGRYPTLVVRTPYGVQRDGVHETMIKFAQKGYAVVMNDKRVRYE